MPNKKTYTDVAHDAADQLADAARRTRQAIDQAAQKAKQRAKEFGEAAADRVDESRAPVAEALHGASEASQVAADRLKRGARYIEEHDTSEMASDLMGVVKRHPLPSLLIAAGLGFVLAKTTRRD